MARLKLREGWITVALLLGMILAVTGSLQRADWSDDLNILTPIALLGLGLGVVLAKWQRLPVPLAHLIALIAGGALIVNRLDPVLPLAPHGHGWLPAARFLLARAQAWYVATGTDQYADDFYLFITSLAGIVWIIAYSSAWWIFRVRWIWPALLLPAVVLLLNLGYAPASVSSYLVLFVICALLLLARFHVVEREEQWRRAGVTYPEGLGWRVLWIGAIFVLLTVGFGWGAPFSAHGAPLATAWARINTPWQRVETLFNARFGSLRGPGARGIGNFASFGDRFRLGGPLKLSQNPVLVLQADRPYYLKVRTYDTFDGHQWDSDVDATFNRINDGRQYVPQIDLKGNQDLAVQAPAATERRDLTIRALSSLGNGLFTADQFVNVSQDSYVVLSWTQYRNQVFDLTTTQAGDLPPDLRRIYGLLKTPPGPLRDTDDRGNVLKITGGRAAGTSSPSASPSASPTLPPVTPTPYLPTPAPWERAIADEQAALQARLIQVRPVVKDGIAVKLIVDGQLPNYGDVEAVLPHSVIAPGTTYKTSVLTSYANAPQLRDAGGAYPAWVTQRYLQLPASTTERTRQLATDLGNGQDPYDAAVSIQNWLRDNIKYNENIPFPPTDRDTVDYLLFDSKQGYCEYYSTAMVVMLRSLGIPAREAVGFFSGEYDNDQLGYLYRESNAHAWVEAYFPGYGWVSFEPTAPRPIFDREPAAPGATNGSDPNGGGTNETGGQLPEDPDMNVDAGSGRYTNMSGTTPSSVRQAARITLPLVLLAIVLLVVLWLGGLRGLSPGSQFYARMTRLSALAGVRPPSGTTPYEWARVVGDRVPDARRSLAQITDLYVRERFAGQTPTPQDLRIARRAWLSFRALLLRSLLSVRRQRDQESVD